MNDPVFHSIRRLTRFRRPVDLEAFTHANQRFGYVEAFKCRRGLVEYLLHGSRPVFASAQLVLGPVDQSAEYIQPG